MKPASSEPIDPFLLEDFLPYALAIAANRTSRLFARRYSRAFGLSVPQWRVLAAVGRFGVLSQAEVLERTDLDKVKISRAATALVAAGLLERHTDPADARFRRLELSEKGRVLHQAIVPLARMLEAQLAAGLTPAELASLRSCLAKLSAHARRLEAAD